jgi:hypothetical protein
MLALIRAQFHGTAIWLGRRAAVDTGKIACLGHFPDGDERPFVEVGGVDLRVHEPMRIRRHEERSDQSPRLRSVLDFPRKTHFNVREPANRADADGNRNRLCTRDRRKGF